MSEVVRIESARTRACLPSLVVATALVAGLALPAHAAATPGVDAGRALLSLLLVVALIVVLGAVLKGRGLAGGTAHGAIEVRAQLPLGPRDRVVVLRVGSEELLVAVSPAGVRTLHVLAAPLPVTPEVVDAGTFADRLKSMLRGGGGR